MLILGCWDCYGIVKTRGPSVPSPVTARTLPNGDRMPPPEFHRKPNSKQQIMRRSYKKNLSCLPLWAEILRCTDCRLPSLLLLPQRTVPLPALPHPRPPSWLSSRDLFRDNSALRDHRSVYSRSIVSAIAEAVMVSAWNLTKDQYQPLYLEAWKRELQCNACNHFVQSK